MRLGSQVSMHMSRKNTGKFLARQFKAPANIVQGCWLSELLDVVKPPVICLGCANALHPVTFRYLGLQYWDDIASLVCKEREKDVLNGVRSRHRESSPAPFCGTSTSARHFGANELPHSNSHSPFFWLSCMVLVACITDDRRSRGFFFKKEVETSHYHNTLDGHLWRSTGWLVCKLPSACMSLGSQIILQVQQSRKDRSYS